MCGPSVMWLYQSEVKSEKQNHKDIYLSIKRFVLGIWQDTVVGAGSVILVTYLSLCLMLKLKVHRAGSWEGKMDVKWRKARMWWNS